MHFCRIIHHLLQHNIRTKLSSKLFWQVRLRLLKVRLSSQLHTQVPNKILNSSRSEVRTTLLLLSFLHDAICTNILPPDYILNFLFSKHRCILIFLGSVNPETEVNMDDDVNEYSKLHSVQGKYTQKQEKKRNRKPPTIIVISTKFKNHPQQ